MNKPTFTYDLLDCPSAEELIRYRERKLTRKREDEIRYHLTFCVECKAVLVTAQQTEVPETVQMPEGFMEKVNQEATQELRSQQGREGVRVSAGSAGIRLAFSVPSVGVSKELDAGDGRFRVEFRDTELGTRVSTVCSAGQEREASFQVLGGEGEEHLVRWETDENGHSDIYLSEAVLPAGEYILMMHAKPVMKPTLQKHVAGRAREKPVFREEK